MALKDIEVRKANAKDKPYKLYDEQGLYVLIHPIGGKYWQFKYRYFDKEKTLSIGPYPEIALTDAREKAGEARKLLRDGLDPSAEKRLAKQRAKFGADNSFRTIAEEWHGKRMIVWTSKHAKKVLGNLEDDVFPELGRRPISQIKPMDVLLALRKIEERGAIYTAHCIKQSISQVFRYAVACGKADRDVTVDLKGALKPARTTNFSRLSANELPEFIQKVSEYDGELQTKLALNLLLLTFVRTTELRGATWKEVDLDKHEWRIPAERMKMRKEHIVPLSKQAIALFSELQLLTGNSEYVFPNRNRPHSFMSENTLLYAIYRMGYHKRTTAHGFRGMASTILHEHGFSSDLIEKQLAHGDRNKVRASYNHAAYLPARKKMMQWWADYIDRSQV